MPQIKDTTAICLTCHWRGGHAPDCIHKNEPWPMINVSGAEWQRANTLVVSDLDGTLALNAHRDHFLKLDKSCTDCGGVGFLDIAISMGDNHDQCQWCDGTGVRTKKNWDAFNKACIDDQPNMPVIYVLFALERRGYTIQVWSGRDDLVRPETITWFQKHRIPYAWLTRMRPRGDHTEDPILKMRWLMELPAPPMIVFDDRDRVVAMWREQGIVCAQVAPGNF